MEETGTRMARAVLRPLDDQVNRRSKDSIFCHLFAQPEYLLQMYAALHPEDDVTQIEDITLVTLDHTLVNPQYNDLGFIVGNRLMILVEHQSTWTVNILIRLLMYVGETYYRYVRNNNLKIYGTRLVEVPRPELYVIYPGARGDKPDEISLARDVFALAEGETPFVDVRAKILYEGREGDIISQYITFCRVFDEQRALYGRTETAVRETIRICRDREVLRTYLAQREVEDLMFGRFDEDYQLEMMREEAREAGKSEGETLLGSLMSRLLSLGRIADAQRASTDPEYRQQLYKEFQLT